ncbi:acetylglutamate kinase [Methanobacterium congolense]|jgi:acetylglutamate kinase|uniref:Acetylglutamate kinase n=1 Tax=Methanobacterium congolense TaxID=118062 RepID=A0A1D3L2A4_9EURY|nr:acetylglutamate kinase [Methanobacterium congolense]SCG85794.1 putative acetylglutamate kinase [Methanobacterium congolense]
METVNILIEALPYIKKFHKKKILIKYGGHAMIDDTTMSSTARDTVLLKYVGMKPIVVHGGGPEISRSMNKLGKEPKFIGGLRITDQETMEIIKMVLVGKINTDIVSKVCVHGGKGIGISGKDNLLLNARKRAPQVIVDGETGEETTIDLGLVGEIDSVNPEVIDMLTMNDYIPIISPIGVDDRGNTLNLNADTVAGDVASSVDAEKLIILTDVPGILEDPNDPETLIKKVQADEVMELIDQGIVKDGMIPKVMTCLQAVENGVSSAHIIDGRIQHSVLLEIFTKKGIGTMIKG